MGRIPKNTIGLEIRNASLTAVVLEMEKDVFKVTNYSRVSIDPGVVDENSIIIDQDAFKVAVEKLFKNGKTGEIKSRNVIISIPEEKTFSHYLKVPAEDADDHEAILKYAKDFIPIDLSSAAVDYKRLNSQKEKKQVVYDFVAVQKNIVQSLVDILQDVGLDVVAIDVDKNSLMRACQAYKREQATMLIEVNHTRSLVSIQNKYGLSHALSLSFGEEVVLEHLKKELDIEVTSDAKELLENIRSGKLEDTEKNQKAQEIFDGFMKTFASKIKELAKVAKVEWGMDVDVTYFIELGKPSVELRNIVKKELPETKILDRFENVQIEGAQQRFYFNSIGLALRGVSEVIYEREANLLPQDEKEELHIAHTIPILRMGLALTSVVLAGLVILSGVMMAGTYFDYLSVQKGLIISQEKVSNPYLAKAVQANQQQEQMQEQVKTILENNIPSDRVIGKIHRYNKDEIGLMDVSYRLGLDGKMNVGIRAKTSSREETKMWVAQLSSDPIFLDVNSPLSNLVGKGERFIQVDLAIDQSYLLGETLKASASVDSQENEIEEVEIEEGTGTEDEMMNTENTKVDEEEPLDENITQ